MSRTVRLQSKLVFLKSSAVVHLPIAEPTLFYDRCLSTNNARVKETDRDFAPLSFWAFSKNCEERLLASSCLSVCPHATTRLPLVGFS